jgi:hypothetical protein
MAAAWAQWVTLSVVEGAGHLFEEPGALEEAVDRTADFFSRRLLPMVVQRKR